MKKISLLGCGKLGYPLAIKLLNQGYTVTALRKISLRFFKDKHDLISNYNVRNANDFMKSLFHGND